MPGCVTHKAAGSITVVCQTFTMICKYLFLFPNNKFPRYYLFDDSDWILYKYQARFIFASFTLYLHVENNYTAKGCKELEL